MINIERALNTKFPKFASKPAFIRKPTVSFLRKVIHENELNEFLETNKELEGVAFIDAVFERLNFQYNADAIDRNKIPQEGKLIIVANHPIGSLDGLSLIKFIREIRPDARIVANDLLNHVKNLRECFIGVDNMTGSSARKSYKAVLEALSRDEAVIIFPAGEVSRASKSGVIDGKWLPGFLNFSRKSRAPVLPIHIDGKNSLLFYGASMVYKPLGTALLAHEMFKQASKKIQFRVGDLIPPHALKKSEGVHNRTIVAQLKRYLYGIPKRQEAEFQTEKPVAEAESKAQLTEELKSAKHIGDTRDGNGIFLVDYQENSAMIRELGRLREIAFRKVGEGTGRSRDLDEYDKHYRHLVLWNREDQEIAGAYRLGEGSEIMSTKGVAGFYTNSLYKFEPEFSKYLEQAVELGRSFINPKYWGKASLDYLWQGLGSYIAHDPKVRYLIGPVSMSADYPKALMDMLACFYRRYHQAPELLAKAKNPYLLLDSTIDKMDTFFGDLSRGDAFDKMQVHFKSKGFRLPVLFKQYAAIFEEGGFMALVFSVDPDFGDCLDGLCMTDLTKIKPEKRKRYFNIEKFSR